MRPSLPPEQTEGLSAQEAHDLRKQLVEYKVKSSMMKQELEVRGNRSAMRPCARPPPRLQGLPLDLEAVRPSWVVFVCECRTCRPLRTKQQA